MALIRFNNGTTKNVTAEVGAEIWAVLIGEIEGDAEQEAVCATIRSIHLNWHVAPDSYIEKYRNRILPMATGRWMVASEKAADYKHTSMGALTRPEPSDQFGKDFAKKWGLEMVGNVSPLGVRY